jgi:hypothetical protein
MKYCVEDYVNLSTEFKELVDEITIYYQNMVTPELIEFLDNNRHRRVNLFIAEEEEFFKKNQYKVIAAIYEEQKYNISLLFNNYNEEKYIEYLSQKRIPFFYKDNINNWDTLVGMLELGVSDVYIVEDLGFDIINVAERVHSYNAQVRVFPNVAQSAWKNTPAIKKFFIRPEDMPLYEGLVDVCEFFGKSRDFSVYYKIYAVDKEWFGLLDEIIIGFDGNLDGRYIIPNFGECRVKCGKKCVQRGKCQICDRIDHLSKNLEASGFYIDMKKLER